LVEVGLTADGDLPLAADLDPYSMGATPSDYGDADCHGQQDPYVIRRLNDVDERVAAALALGYLTILYGPSKSGKTRTAFEAVRGTQPNARIAAPVPTELAQLVGHPRIQHTNDCVVLWLDDLDRYLVAQSSTLALLRQAKRRPGELLVIATLRTEARARLVALAGGELARADQQLLSAAKQIELHPTDEDPHEQAAAREAYPNVDLSSVGLAEQLACAPALLNHYRDLQYHEPIQYAVVQIVIDWMRIGMPRAIGENDLVELVEYLLWNWHPELAPSKTEIRKAVQICRSPLVGHGRAAVIVTEMIEAQQRGYRPFDYLVAADNGEGSPSREIAQRLWARMLQYMRPEEFSGIAKAAYERGNNEIAIEAAHRGAEMSDPEAMNALGILLYENDAPDYEEARKWLLAALARGVQRALNNLGQLVRKHDPENIAEALEWYCQAAEAGSQVGLNNLFYYAHGAPASVTDPLAARINRLVLRTEAQQDDVNAMLTLGVKHARARTEAEFEKARYWFMRAAGVGSVIGMNNYGYTLARLQQPPDLAAGKMWLSRAAEAGDLCAMVNLYTIYSKIQIPPDTDAADYWLSRATSAGVSDVEKFQDDMDNF
jgi:TPR repeat protein